MSERLSGTMAYLLASGAFVRPSPLAGTIKVPFGARLYTVPLDAPLNAETDAVLAAALTGHLVAEGAQVRLSAVAAGFQAAIRRGGLNYREPLAPSAAAALLGAYTGLVAHMDPPGPDRPIVRVQVRGESIQWATPASPRRLFANPARIWWPE